MTGNTSIATAPTQIPNELCAAIVNHLHEDKHTLLALALTNKAWCAESQRVLFRTVLDQSVDLDSVQYTHGLFLNAILRNPTLGTYVHTYSQQGAICHPHLGTKNSLFKVPSILWELTEVALPALVNLKNLCIVPFLDDEATAPLLEFKGCTFSLRSLIWRFQPFNASRTGPWIEFLRNQHELVHLKVGGIMSSVRQDYSWLTDDACPNLMSTTCLLPSPIVCRPAIVGLRIVRFEEGLDESQIAGLRRLRYLSIPADLAMISALGAIHCNLVLLEIWGWRFEKDRLLPDFPDLRILVFIHIEALSDVAAVEDAKTKMTIESFRRCPMLEYIVMEDTSGDEGKRYRKLTIPDPIVERSLDTAPDIKNEEFFMEPEGEGRLWWTAYGV